MFQKISAALVLFFCSLHLSAQIKEIDVISQSIGSYYLDTKYEMKTDLLETGQVRFSFRLNNENIIEKAEVYLASQAELDELYSHIKVLFEQNKNKEIKLDLGDSILHLHYERMIIGGQIVFSHAYKSSPYASRTSPYQSHSAIRKAFRK